MKIKIKRGGWRQMAAPVNKAIITILTGSPEAGIGASILTHAQGKLVGRLVDGKWEGSMKYIVARVARKFLQIAYESKYLRN